MRDEEFLWEMSGSKFPKPFLSGYFSKTSFEETLGNNDRFADEVHTYLHVVILSILTE